MPQKLHSCIDKDDDDDGDDEYGHDNDDNAHVDHGEDALMEKIVMVVVMMTSGVGVYDMIRVEVMMTLNNWETTQHGSVMIR